MSADHIRTLFDNIWAWNHVLVSMTKLEDGAYKEKRPLFGQTSLHKLLIHCLAGKSVWLSRCLGRNLTSMFDPNAYNDVTAGQEHWAAMRDDWVCLCRRWTTYVVEYGRDQLRFYKFPCLKRVHYS